MPLTKYLSGLEIDYSDGFDVEGVHISARVLKIICARIPPEEFTHKRVLNECISFGLGYRDEIKFMADWAKEKQHKQSQDYGRWGGKKTSDIIKEMHEDWQSMADSLFKNNPSMSIRKAAEGIAKYAVQDWGKDYSADHIRKYIKKVV